MSRLTADQALEMVFTDDSCNLDSGGELDIDEDPDFPLPHYSDSENEEQLPRNPGSPRYLGSSDSETCDLSFGEHSNDLESDPDDNVDEGQQI